MQFNASEFTIGRIGVFSAEASDFGARFDNLFGIFHNSNDVGFELVNDLSDRSDAANPPHIKMMFTEAHRDSEGELTHWEFVSRPVEWLNSPDLLAITVYVFND